MSRKPRPTGGADAKKPDQAQLDEIRKALNEQLQNSEYNPEPDLPDILTHRPDGAGLNRKFVKPTDDTDPYASFADLRPKVPVLLFPVRLETRFTDDLTQLRIRIYPDQASIDTRDPRLTAEELKAGRTFNHALKAANTRAERLAHWREFATAYDPRYAAHIHRMASRRGAANSLREPGDSAPARAPLLPDRWFVTGISGGQVAFDEHTKPVSTDIAFSPDLSQAVEDKGDLALDPATRWMVNYDEAVIKGMAVTVDLPAFARAKIDEIYVVGVRTTDATAGNGKLTPRKAARQLDALLDSHLHDWGAGFVPPATATNNTSDVTAGWTDRDPDLDEMFDRLIDTDPAPPEDTIDPATDETLTPAGTLAAGDNTEASNHRRLERALGLDDDALREMENHGGAEDRAQAAMNTLLWPVTWGELLGPMLAQRDTPMFEPATLDWLRRWFIDNVRGGASLPTLRVGSTPYGVLPVTKVHLMQEPAVRGDQARRQQQLGAYLRGLLPHWEDAARDTPRMGAADTAGRYTDPGERFLQILRQQPHPTTHSQSRVSSERHLFDLRYEIRRLIVHPDQNTLLFQDVFRSVDVQVTVMGFKVQFRLSAPGEATYRDWPASFVNGANQLAVLAGKRQILLDLLKQDSMLYQALKVPVAGIVVDVSTPAYLAMSARADDINALADYLQQMIDLCVEHQQANTDLVDALDLSSDAVDGQVGSAGQDPHMSFLSFSDTLTQWDANAHVVVARDRGEIGFAAQIDYLKGFANSFVSSSPAPTEPVFPDYERPLLYQLLKEAIQRTGADDDPIALRLMSLGAEAGSGATAVADAVAATDPHDLGTLADRLGNLRSQPAEDDPLSATLRALPPDTMRDLGTALAAAGKERADDTTFPHTQAKDLAAAITALDQDRRPSGVVTVPLTRQSKMDEIKQALITLRNLNPDQMGLLMAQTLGLAGWRLDAWLTSLAQARVDSLRDGAQRRGVQVGAFGWVQDLRPNNRTRNDGNRVRSQGFIHTPSPGHAKTAAVLRSGWTNYGNGAASSPVAVNLSSDRMREAQWLFDAVRRGQDLGDMLGYRFERRLKDTEGAHWIFPVRQAVLDMTGLPPDPEQPGVDGLELGRILASREMDVLEHKASAMLRELGGADKLDTFQAVTDAAAHMSGLSDAMADAAIANSVHSLVQGNLMRSGSDLSAISDGEVPPPELDMLRTTPPARTQTHRVMIAAPNTAGAAWVSNPAAWPVAAADPDAEALAAVLLGPAKQLRFVVEWRDAKGNVVAQDRVNWAEMLAAASPFAAPAWQTMMMLPPGDVTAQTALGQRVLAHAAAFTPRDVAPGAQASLRTGSAEDLARNALLDRWRGWRSVLADARPIAPRDLPQPATNDENGVAAALNDLETRAANLRVAFSDHVNGLQDALPKPVEGDDTPQGTTDPAKLMARFDGLARMGVNAAVFQTNGTIDAAACYAHAWSLVPILKRITSALRPLTPNPDATPEARIKTARATLRAILGRSFPGLCRLKGAPVEQLIDNLKGSDARLDLTHAATPVQWIERLGYVRPAMRTLNDALLVQDCQPKAPGGLRLHLAQWPETEVRPWIAVESSRGEDAPTQSAVVAQVGGAALPVAAQGMAGLIVDEVVDRLPARHVNSGVALHYDAPNTEAPQTLLLALPPRGGSWDYATMIDTVRDAFQLARIRTVDGHLMSGANQFLPAIYAGRNLHAKVDTS